MITVRTTRMKVKRGVPILLVQNEGAQIRTCFKRFSTSILRSNDVPGAAVDFKAWYLIKG